MGTKDQLTQGDRVVELHGVGPPTDTRDHRPSASSRNCRNAICVVESWPLGPSRPSTRVREEVYRQSSILRHQLNNQERREPVGSQQLLG